MASFFSPTAASPKVQLAATAILSAALAAGAVLGFQRLQEVERLSRLKRSIPEPEDGEHAIQELSRLGPLPKPDKDDIRNEALARRAQNGDFDDELILEQLARNRVFLGPEGLDKLRDAFVIVVGCGGVGSHCAAALARSGVSKIRLVDFDQVTLSSLNRHAVATLADVGLPKVQCIRRRLIAVTPWVRFDMRLEKFDGNSAKRLLGPWEGTARKPDFVVDAIDNIDTKVELLKFCYDNKLPVISSMGAGIKSDPTRIVIGDISVSTDDGLSRATRRKLKLRGVTSGIPVVYSTETMGNGKAELLPLPEEEFQKGSVGDLGVLPDFRVRILPVLGTMPAVFGYTLANHIILSITGYPTEYVPAKGREKLYETVQNFVQGMEEKLARQSANGAGDPAIGLRTPLTLGDISFLVEEIFKGRSAITGVATRLVLVRWKKPAGSTLVRIGEGAGEQRSSNLKLRELVCMTKEEAARHLKEVVYGNKTADELYDSETIQKIEKRLGETAAYEGSR